MIDPQVEVGVAAEAEVTALVVDLQVIPEADRAPLPMIVVESAEIGLTEVD